MGKGYTIEEAAQIYGVSKDTIRRKIRSRAICAYKESGRHGEQWYIPPEQLESIYPKQTPSKGIQHIQEIKPSVPDINIEEIRQMIESALEDTVRKAVHEEMHVLHHRLDEQDRLMQEHYALVDRALRKSLKKPEKIPLWKRLFTTDLSNSE